MNATAPAAVAPRKRFAALGVALAMVALTVSGALGASVLALTVGFASYLAVLVGAVTLCALRVIRVREERPAWTALTIALAAWLLGDLYYVLVLERLAGPPIPSPADLGYLAFYPGAAVTLVLVARSRAPGLGPVVWLDGAIAGLSVAALGAAFVFDAVLRTTHGSPAVIATNLAYPLADLVLVAFAVWLLAAGGWRWDRTLGLLSAGFLVCAVADASYLMLTAVDAYRPGGPLDLVWPLAFALLAAAAWQRPAALPVPDETRMLLLPALFALLALALLAGGSLLGLDALAVALATGALVAVVARMVLAIRAYLIALASAREEAKTDSLTRLGNRRRLMEDLERQVFGAPEPSRWTLALFDLNGFKTYNDTFGHLAGDALLARLAGRLREAVEGRARAYRLGGDEFCLLVERGDEPPRSAVRAAAQALREHGEGFAIDSSYGQVLIPEEADSVERALRRADQRMYGHKRNGGAGSVEREALLRALSERGSPASPHLTAIGGLARAVAVELGLRGEEMDEVVRAAELNDVGKVALPDAVLNKPGPLTTEELALIREHSLIGAHILAAAPALRPLARLVRASHERWDGGGYPDGAAGQEIPLGARIIHACNALQAMVSERPHAAGVPLTTALAELRRGAGTQFDPAVVQALADILERRRALHRA